jgi:hypothetical protein
MAQGAVPNPVVSYVLAALLAPLAVGASTPPGTILTYAGGGPNNIPALQADVSNPVNTAVDSAGN